SSDVAIFWLDDRTVIFLGYDLAKLAGNVDGGRYANGVFVWDLTNNRVTPLFVANRTSKLCVFKGLISFQAELADNTNAIFEGSIEQLLGNQARRKTPDARKYPRARWPHCAGLPDGLEDGSRFVPLLPAHGYIEMRPGGGETPRYSLVRRHGESGI